MYKRTNEQVNKSIFKKYPEDATLYLVSSEYFLKVLYLLSSS